MLHNDFEIASNEIFKTKHEQYLEKILYDDNLDIDQRWKALKVYYKFKDYFLEVQNFKIGLEKNINDVREDLDNENKSVIKVLNSLDQAIKDNKDEKEIHKIIVKNSCTSRCFKNRKIYENYIILINLIIHQNKLLLSGKLNKDYNVNAITKLLYEKFVNIRIAAAFNSESENDKESIINFFTGYPNLLNNLVVFKCDEAFKKAIEYAAGTSYNNHEKNYTYLFALLKNQQDEFLLSNFDSHTVTFVAKMLTEKFMSLQFRSRCVEFEKFSEYEIGQFFETCDQYKFLKASETALALQNNEQKEIEVTLSDDVKKSIDKLCENPLFAEHFISISNALKEFNSLDNLYINNFPVYIESANNPITGEIINKSSLDEIFSATCYRKLIVEEVHNQGSSKGV